MRVCQSSDTHDVSRGRGSFAEALGRIKARCLVAAVTSDILFPPEYHEEMAAMIPQAEMRLINSEFAHDGFLIEHEQLDNLISDFRKAHPATPADAITPAAQPDATID